MSDNNCIIIPCGDPGTELFPSGSLEILFRRNKQLCTRIQPQEFVCPLKRQMIRNDKHTLLAQPQPLRFHCGSRHLKCLPHTHFMGEQRISAVKHMGNGV